MFRCIYYYLESCWGPDWFFILFFTARFRCREPTTAVWWASVRLQLKATSRTLSSSTLWPRWPEEPRSSTGEPTSESSHSWRFTVQLQIKGGLFQGLLCALESCGPLREDVSSGHSEMPRQTGELTCHTTPPSRSSWVVFWCFCVFIFPSTAADRVSGRRFWLSVFPAACRWSSEWRRRVWGGFSRRRAA